MKFPVSFWPAHLICEGAGRGGCSFLHITTGRHFGIRYVSYSTDSLTPPRQNRSTRLLPHPLLNETPKRNNPPGLPSPLHLPDYSLYSCPPCSSRPHSPPTNLSKTFPPSPPPAPSLPAPATVPSHPPPLHPHSQSSHQSNASPLANYPRSRPTPSRTAPTLYTDPNPPHPSPAAAAEYTARNSYPTPQTYAE